MMTLIAFLFIFELAKTLFRVRVVLSDQPPLHAFPPQQHHCHHSKAPAPDPEHGKVPASTSCVQQRLENRHAGCRHGAPCDTRRRRRRARLVWIHVYEQRAVRCVEEGAPEALHELQHQGYRRMDCSLNDPTVRDHGARCHCQHPVAAPRASPLDGKARTRSCGHRVDLWSSLCVDAALVWR